MKKLFSGLVLGVLIGSTLLLPASAAAEIAPSAASGTVLSAEQASVQPYAALCGDCGIGQVRYDSKTEGPWIFVRYVDCLSGDQRYRDKEYYRDVTKYYLCDYCGSGFGSSSRETKVEHEHAW